ncbi:PleD family two-component system response regulator [Pseudanabaena sp. FACHB-2040]|uniref:GGDEF domain-containing response regulator n=1 Tax=Pseudanabaena sp. FACHB-2040 TaxID=2692859 RepID=UPI001685165C|nr:PleD family two-component system response regulator [Pseudanabaena sp. FACHB-2040]MBD2256480.1 PleD family two-component system response regulator [Pseudanabaena sp. FACHB-2040]
MLKRFNPEDYLILVVDDAPMNLQIVGSMLDETGYATTFANNGSQAISRFKAAQPDLVLLDLMMPGVDGLEVCSALKATYPEIPIIFLTASHESEHLLQAFEQGAADYVTKPFSKPELLARVKTHLMLKHTFSELRTALVEMERLAKTDGLTGLLNRRYLFEAATQELSRAQRYGRAFSVLMVDIDHFKRINDTYGHPVGDVVIQTVASVLTEALREVDLIGRYGGEEFSIILPETPLQKATEVAERIREMINSLPIPAGSENLHITVSTGISGCEGGVQSIDEIFHQADKALYQAKSAGRNTWVVFTQ